MSSVFWTPGVTIDELEKQVIQVALRFYQNNKTHTAQSLGIAIRTLDNKLEKYKQDAESKPQPVKSEVTDINAISAFDEKTLKGFEEPVQVQAKRSKAK